MTDFRALCAELLEAIAPYRLLDTFNAEARIRTADRLNSVVYRVKTALEGDWQTGLPSSPGFYAELVEDLREQANHGYCEFISGDDLRRAADLLECLEQVAYAASDFICGTRFPEFANEHGGIDRLMADLCRLVAQFEHGPRPVPGVDVPGPDGDWGGLAELCNAEGVDLRIGVPLLQRAREAWKYASQAAPVPADELLAAYRSGAADATLAQPAPEGPTDDELDDMANEAGLDLAWRPELRRFARFALARTAAAILQPIPVSKESPWELDCDGGQGERRPGSVTGCNGLPR
jgi:hypothetical protein